MATAEAAASGDDHADHIGRELPLLELDDVVLPGEAAFVIDKFSAPEDRPERAQDVARVAGAAGDRQHHRIPTAPALERLVPRAVLLEPDQIQPDAQADCDAEDQAKNELHRTAPSEKPDVNLSARPAPIGRRD
jgi:hypothetical protein